MWEVGTLVLEIKKKLEKLVQPSRTVLLHQICRVFIILRRVLRIRLPHRRLNLGGGFLGSLSACSPACQTYGTPPPPLQPFTPSPPCA